MATAYELERQQYLDLLGLDDNPELTLSDLKNKTGGGVNAYRAAVAGVDLDWLGEIFLKKNELVINAVDFGADPNELVDNTEIVQYLLEMVRDRGEGTIYFPPGRYLMHGFVDIYSNTTIIGYGAVFVKPPPPIRTSAAIFAARTGANQGYGAGGRNINFIGITIEGTSYNGHNAVIFSGHHADQVTFRDCKAIHCIGPGHWMDLCGCSNILVENCIISGSQRIGTGVLGGEAIQVDISHVGTLSVPEDVPGGADWLPTKNITVRGCTFEEREYSGTVYPAPVAFGSHTSPQQGSYYENMMFVNNICGPTHARAHTEGIAGVVRINSAKRVVVSGNIFDMGGVNTPGISVQPGPQLLRQRESKNVVIANNTFTGYIASPAINVAGDSSADNRAFHEGVVVADNYVSSDGNSTNGHAIYLHVIDTVTATGNLMTLDNHQLEHTGMFISSTVLSGVVANNVLRSAGNINNQSTGVLFVNNQVADPADD